MPDGALATCARPYLNFLIGQILFSCLRREELKRNVVASNTSPRKG
jgi:hypothetical protein